MEQFAMNAEIRGQLEYYVRKLRRLQGEGLSLEDTIAGLMHRDEDWRAQPEAQKGVPPYLPGFGSDTTLPALRMLAESIISMVRQYNRLMTCFLEDPEETSKEWLDAQLAEIQDDAAREARRSMISQAADKLARQLEMLNNPQLLTQQIVAGRPGHGKKRFLFDTALADGLGALLGVGQVAAAVAPRSGGLLSGMLRVAGAISKVMEGCEAEEATPQPPEAEIEQTEESKAIHAAMLYLLCGDGCMPEVFDGIPLRRIVPMVCMTQEMQGVCAQEEQDLDGAERLLRAALEAGVYGTVELLLGSGLRNELISKALAQPEQTLLIFQAACCITPVLTSRIMQMDAARKERLVKNMAAFYSSLNKLAAPAAQTAVQMPKAGQMEKKQKAQQIDNKQKLN